MSVEQDQKNTHAVEFVESLILPDDSSDAGVPVAAKIAGALNRINERALSANMVVLNVAITQSSFYDGNNGHVCTTIICQWTERGALERMQLQQSILGNSSPRR